MGREVFEASPAAREVFETADRILGESISQLCFAGPAERLQQTAHTQPALLATSIALWRALGARCDAVAGHSLGEYSANVAAGSLAFEDALRLVRARGTFMQEAVPLGAGAMAAVLGAERATVDTICRATPGVVEAVNFNCPGQIVIAGQAAAVAAATMQLKSAGAKVLPLPVSAPFHSSLMRPAEDRLRPQLEAAEFRAAQMPVTTNVDAAATQDPAALRQALTRQVSRAVRWQESIESMRRDGIELFVEIGPGKVLSGLIQRIDAQARCLSVQGPEDFEAVRAVLGA